jgi:hypothetical protein
MEKYRGWSIYEVVMPLFHTTVLTGLAMLAFAGNSLLCRLALNPTPLMPRALRQCAWLRARQCWRWS